jgi:hypothetical protein
MRLHTCLLFTALALGGCAAPQSTEQMVANADSKTAAAQAAAPATPVTTVPNPPRLKVRTGGPLPPQVLPEPVKLDYHCTSDADCAVKDIGNCCGAYPACVNKDSPTDPAGVQAQCAKQGRMSACGFRPVDACSCTQGRCTPRADTSQSQVR